MTGSAAGTVSGGLRKQRPSNCAVGIRTAVFIVVSIVVAAGFLVILAARLFVNTAGLFINTTGFLWFRTRRNGFRRYRGRLGRRWRR